MSFFNYVITGNKQIELGTIDIGNTLKCEQFKHQQEFDSWILQTNDGNHKFQIMHPRYDKAQRFYLRTVVGCNVILYFVFIDDKSNNTINDNTDDNKDNNIKKKSSKHQKHNPSDILPISTQKMMIEIAEYMNPSKYLCFIINGTASNNSNYDKIKQELYDIVINEFEWNKDHVMFFDQNFYNNSKICLTEPLLIKIESKINKKEQIKSIISLNDNNNINPDNNVIISIYHFNIAKKHLSMFIIGTVLSGKIAENDELLLYPINKKLKILTIYSYNRQVKSAQINERISIKTQIDSSFWKHKKSSKYLLISPNCIHNLKLNHLSVNTILNHKYSEKDIVCQLYLSSKQHFKKGFYKNQEILISYLGYRYPVRINNLHFRPSIDTINEWKIFYDNIVDILSVNITPEIIQIIYEHILPLNEWSLKIGLLQEESSKITLYPTSPISYFLSSPYNKFIVLTANECIAKGIFLGSSFFTLKPFNSKILNNSEKMQILKWIPNIKSYSKINLIHRASDDGFSAADFHKNCNNKKPTITIIKTFKKYVFGGFTTTSWKSYQGRQQFDTKTFIFSLRGSNNNGDNDKDRKKYRLSKRKGPSITLCSSKGPVFGRSDIVISDNCNTNISTLKLNGCFGVKKCLAESTKFIVNDYEVFQLLK